MAGTLGDRTSDDENEDARHADALSLRSIEAVLADPATSEWLKAAIETLVDRDPVDALNDALVLASLFDERLRMAWGIDEEGR